MRNRWALIGLLVLSTVVVDMAVWSVDENYLSSGIWMPETVAHRALEQLCVGQVGLLAIWAGLGARSLPWRLAVLICVIVSWAAAFGALWLTFYPKAVATSVTVSLLLISAPLVVAARIGKTLGLRVSRARPTQSSEEELATGLRWQFSLGYLFSWLTAAALSLGLLKYTVHRPFIHVEAVYFVRFGMIAFGTLLLSLAALWMMLGSGKLGLRIGALLLAAGGAAIANYSTYWACDLWIEVFSTAVEMCYILAALAMIRAAGYRLVWHEAPAVPLGER